MKRVLITGADGFIGRNLRAQLALESDNIELLTHDVSDGGGALAAKAERADFVFHLAGVNRPQDPAQFAQNAVLSHEIAELLRGMGRSVPVVLASSSQAVMDNPYGKSKREAEEIIFRYGEQAGAPTYIYRFTNVFGKWCRPGYNSVVATFCYNAANGLPLHIDDPERLLRLLYVDDLVTEMKRALDGCPTPGAEGFCFAGPEQPITLGRLRELIEGFARSRGTLMHDYDRKDALARQLYATFLSYIPPDTLSVTADMKCDLRGYFAELIKSPHFGQISVSRTKPGITRGQHWHHTKVEKFIVVEGKGVVAFRQIEGTDVIEYPVSGEKIEIIDIPPGYTHSLTNTGETDMLAFFWAGELFDPDEPDTIALEV